MIDTTAHVIIFVANGADEVFVNTLLSFYQENSPRPIRTWEVFNLKGIKRRNQRIRQKIDTIKARISEVQIIVFTFCTNIALYPFCEKPVVDWTEIKGIAKDLQIQDFYEIIVDDLIEDWVLEDLTGLCNYISIEIPEKIEGSGYQKMVALFRTACRQYISEYSIPSVLPYLDINKIRSAREKSLCKLEEVLQVNN